MTSGIKCLVECSQSEFDCLIIKFMLNIFGKKTTGVGHKCVLPVVSHCQFVPLLVMLTLINWFM